MDSEYFGQRHREAAELEGAARDLTSKGRLDMLGHITQAMAQLEALAIGLQAELAQAALNVSSRSGETELAMRSMGREVAAKLTVSNRSATRSLEFSRVMAQSFPAVLQAQADGVVTSQQARLIVAEGLLLTDADVSDESREAYAAAAIAAAPGRIPGTLKPIVQRLAERFSPRSITERHEVAVGHRNVSVTDVDDGMAYLTAYLPGVVAHAIMHRLDHGAEKRCKSDPRDAGQWKADVLAALLTTGTATDRIHEHCEEPNCMPRLLEGITAHVAITVPASSLVVDDQTGQAPAILNHAATMSMTAAAVLIGRHNGALERWVTDPVTKQVTAVDARFANTHLTRQVLARDGAQCRGLTCTNRRKLELDHTIPWSHAGPTSVGNLAALCKSCHTVKDFTAWRLSQPEPGRLEWTTPSGHSYVDLPPPF